MSDTSFSPRPLEGVSHNLFPPQDKQVGLQPAEGTAMIHACIPINKNKHTEYVEIKCQLEATEVFIADLIACSTCFGHHYVRFAGCCSILQTGHITLSSTPEQQLENRSTKYHRQQPLYNTLELLLMGIVVPETC